MSTFNLAGILEKMASRDKDFRYMATSDLLTELQKENFKKDTDSERRIVSTLLKLLEDPSGDLQGLAVKCFGPLVKRISENLVQEILESLCNLLTKEKNEEVRDIATIGITTVIDNCHTKDGPLVVQTLTKRLVGILQKDFTAEVKLMALEILNNMLQRFGGSVTEHEALQTAILPQLTSNRHAARKRAISCLAHLAVHEPEKLFGVLIEHLLKSSATKKTDNIRTFTQAIGAISRSAGYRLGKYMDQIIKIVAQFCKDPKFEQDDELKENCFQTFESLVWRCPKEVTAHLDLIIDFCLTFLKHDPNFDEDVDEMETSEPDEDEEEDDGEYSADDDMSWKVRRASAKCLSAIILTRPEMLKRFYTQIAPALIARFREREETVKIDVFNTFVDLLRQTKLVVTKSSGLQSKDSPLENLRELVPRIVSTITRQLKQKSVKTRVGVFSLLKELLLVLPGALADHVPAFIPGIEASLEKNTTSNLKIDGLSFLRILLATHPEEVFQKHIKVLSTPVIRLVADPYYKIEAEALRVCCELVRIIGAKKGDPQYETYVTNLYNATLQKLKAQDIDQEVKEAAINCMGLIISTHGDYLKSQLPECLAIILERLSNEITRLITIKAVARIAACPLNIDLTPILTEVINELSNFLRKNNRQIKQSSLSALDVIIRKYGNSPVVRPLFGSVLTEVAPIISDSDFHLTHLGLQLTVGIVRSAPEAAPQVKEKLYPKILDLIKTSLLQGSALTSLLSLYEELVKLPKGESYGFGFDFLFDSLFSLRRAATSRQCFTAISQCVAVICAHCDASKLRPTVEQLIDNISSDDTTKLLSLLCLGELGRRINLSEFTQLQPVILSAFESSSEESKSAASFALGSTAVGSLKEMLPFILKEIKSNSKRQYLLIHSLREIISRQSFSPDTVKALEPHLEEILPLLFSHGESDEEGTRNVVAECLGKLALIQPRRLLSALQELQQHKSTRVRATVVTAVKSAIIEQPHPIDELLHPLMPHFLEMLQDKEVLVRRAALLMFNHAIHNKPPLIRDNLDQTLPVLYDLTKVKAELIRDVDLGPFKHKVDDGLEIRKAAFECMYTLLEVCLDRLNIHIFISHLVDGLKDHYDIKMLSHLMLVRLAQTSGPALTEGLDVLVEPLRTTVTTKVKDNAVKQELERNEELIRSALRAIVAISKLENTDRCVSFISFLNQLTKGPLAEKFEAVRAETDALLAEEGPLDA